MSANGSAFRIAYCLPVLRSSDTSDSSFLQQTLIVSGLRAAGHAVRIFAYSGLSDVVRSADADVPMIVVRTWTGTRLFEVASKLCWRLQQLLHVPYLNVFSNLRWFDGFSGALLGHDIVQERNGLYKMAVAMACKRLGLPYVLFFDADDILEHDLFRKPLSGILRWRAKQVLRYNLRAADRVICVSASAKRHLAADWKVPEEKIAIFPNSVDVHRFRPCPEARAQLREELSVGGGPIVIFVGSFFSYQDLTVLLRAFASVLKKIPEARLLLVGEGEQYEETLRCAADLGITHETRFLGYRPHSEVPRLLSAADVAVAPYRKIDDERFHGSPMKLFEYMAAGIPLIATDIGQIREIIQNEVNGLLVPADDIEALAGALGRLLDTPMLRSRLGKKARGEAVARYSWEQYISRVEELYESVLRETALREHERERIRPAAH